MARTRPRILVFAGSTRAASFNGRLASLVVKAVAMRDAEPTLLSLADYATPLYEGDLEAASGVPEGARRLHQQMTAHEGIFIASPEYNQSVTPLLKNTIDWVSRIRPEGPRAASPWKGRVFALGSASPGYFGGIRSLMHLRQILELSLGCVVIPDQVSIPSAGSAFSPDGGLVDEKLEKRVDAVVERLVAEAGRFV